MQLQNNNKVTHSPEISRQQVQKITPPPLSTPALLYSQYEVISVQWLPNLFENLTKSEIISVEAGLNIAQIHLYRL